MKRMKRLFLGVAVSSLVVVFVVLIGASVCNAQWTTTGSGDATNNNSSGKVGIGITSPASSLDVSGGPNSEVRFGINNGIQQGVLGTSVRSNYDHILFSRNLAGSAGSDNYQTLGTGSWGYNGVELRLGGDTFFYGNNTSTTGGGTVSSPTVRMAILGTGNVGIGTASPAAPLTVAAGGGDAAIQMQFSSSYGQTRLYAGYDSGTLSNNYLAFRVNQTAGTDSEIMRVRGDGNVGIGTTGPNYKLHVTGAGSGGQVALFERTAGQGLYILSGVNVGGGTESTLSTITSSGNSGGPLAFATGNTEVMRITTGGNVGIGKTNPTVALDVVGSINLTGTVNAKYQDVAEWVPSSEQLSAGTVVVLDSTKSNQVVSSSVSYDTRVAGVVSEQPGIALGEKSENKVLVATTGRVRVKVDASKGAIHIGDLLVTSDIPGVAMKSEPVNLGGVQFHRPGTLIGKALEPLEKGKGEILVLLSLQ